MSVLAPSQHVMFMAAAKAIAPRPHVPFADWLERHAILPDGPNQGERFSFRGAPPLRGIAECLDPEHPSTEVTIRKSQQVGVSVLSVFWMHYLAEIEPANILYMAPTLDALNKFSSDKLQRVIDMMQARRGLEVFYPAISRSGQGSTARSKRFAGGSIFLANGNSATDLSSNTPRFGVEDELSKCENIPVYGDPEELFEGRFTAFLRSGLYKIMKISTPEIDKGDPDALGHCRIDANFQRSDQRFFHIVCPHCQDRFAPKDTDETLTIDRDNPDASLIHCTACGAGLSDFERIRGISHPEAGWVAAKPGKGRQPGFHLDALVSKMVPLGQYVRKRIEAEDGDEVVRKSFFNLYRGLPYALRGEAPEPERIADRPKTVERARQVPPGGLILTMGVDVQKNGLYYEMLATGRDRQDWSLDVGFLEGATDSADGGAWEKLAELVSAPLPDAWGRPREFDAVFVDSGYMAHVVYQFTRRYPRVHASKGVGHPNAPACGTPSKVDIRLDGKKVIRGGAEVWPIGTHGLKAEWFAKINRERTDDGFPPGYVHLGEWNDIRWARQVTSEYLATQKVNGVLRQRWVQVLPDNHYLDTRILCMAAAHKVGLGKMTPAAWDKLEARRGAPVGQDADLFTPAPEQLSGVRPQAAPVPARAKVRRLFNPITGRYVGE